MQEAKNKNFLNSIKEIFWPIELHENKKFIPMALMLACILFNYSTLRSIKDGLIVTSVGAEAISFLKLYAVLPSSIILMVIYAKLSNIMSQRKVFYMVVSLFIGYFALFALVLYPNSDMFHPSSETIDALADAYPNAQWFIRILGKWTYASFYISAEMWGSMMLSLLFWQFANQITKTNEAKRFYSMFGLIANASLLLIAPIGEAFSIEVNGELQVQTVPMVFIIIFNSFLVLFLYSWVNRYVLTDPILYSPGQLTGPKKKKPKLSLVDSFKMIFTSKYLGLIAILVIAYGISINLVEGVWKSKVKELYPTVGAYTAYMFNFQTIQGYAAIFFMLIGSNILRKVSWRSAATFTPVMILFTGLAFFFLINYENEIGLQIAVFFGTGPLAMIVAFGLIQNVLSKATKYSLFDSTKEMSYIPLDEEMRTKGKAAVDVVGGRLGKSGGGFIQSSIFIIVPSYSFAEATPILASIFFVIVVLWLVAVRALGNEYQQKLAENEAAEMAKKASIA